jgi:anthranilate phosphoribosyltransferase
MAAVIAGVLARRGVDGFVFRGDDGLDELTTTTTSRVWAISAGEVSEHVVDPLDLGLARSQPEDLRGGKADFNAQVVRDVVAGRQGPVLDAVLLNAASAIAAYDGGSDDVTKRLGTALEKARASVDSGAARDRLAAWVDAVGAQGSGV